MGCPTQGILGQYMTFSVRAKDGAGEPIAATGDVTYGIYEDETGTPIASGTMAQLGGKTGLYSERFQLTTAGGFELFKTYTIYAEATVSGKSVTKVNEFIIIGSVVSGTVTPGSGRTLSDLKDMCKYHGWHDTTTEGDTALARYINRTLQMLVMLAPWPEYHKRDGEISVTATDDDYELSQSNIAQVGNILRPGRLTPLTCMAGGLDEWMEKKKLNALSGDPLEYAMRKYVSGGLIKVEVMLYPCPAADTTLYYTYRSLPAELSLDTDQTDWPNYREWLLEEALDVRINSTKRDTHGVALEGADFMAKVQKAMGESRLSYMPIMAKPSMDIRNARIREVPFSVVS